MKKKQNLTIIMTVIVLIFFITMAITYFTTNNYYLIKVLETWEENGRYYLIAEVSATGEKERLRISKKFFNECLVNFEYFVKAIGVNSPRTVKQVIDYRPMIYD